MFRNRWVLLVGVIVVIGVLVWGWRRGSGEAAGVDLLAMLPQADKRASPLPVEESIRAVTVEVNGESKNAILEQNDGRIQFKVRVPADAWFSASIAVDPVAWDKPGDGVLFRMGVSDGTSYEELLNQHVDPSTNASDRRWIPVALDLSAYAGRDVKIVLSTNTSMPGKPVDRNNDRGLWGARTLVAGR